MKFIAKSVGHGLLQRQFDEDERGQDDTLRLQFEALQQFDEYERQTAQEVLEGLIPKHQAKQSQMRISGTSTATAKKKIVSP
jgi:hypothetical protein